MNAGDQLGPAAQQGDEQVGADRLRKVVLVVAALNLTYFFIEFVAALSAGSVSLSADSVTFLKTQRSTR